LRVSTLEPFDDPQLLASLKRGKMGVITMENHSVIGGLGSATAELMAEAGVAGPLLRIGLRDVYAHGASREYLMREYGLDEAGLIGAVERLSGLDLGELSVDIRDWVAASDLAKPEAL